MSRRGASCAVLCALLFAGTLEAQASHTQSGPFGPPYEDASSSSGCELTTELTTACVHEAAADAATGNLRVSVDLQASPETGLAFGSGYGTVTLRARHTLAHAVDTLLFSLQLHVDEAAIWSEGTLPFSWTEDLQSTYVGGSLTASVDVSHQGCPACQSHVARELFTGKRSPHAEPHRNQTVTILVPFVNGSGAEIPSGTAEIVFTLTARAWLAGAQATGAGIDPRALAHLRGSLEGFEVMTPTSEDAVTPPYAEATATRSCAASPGTVAACRAAAARSTGRVDVDLSVTSPAAGTAPGSGSAAGTVRVRGLHAPDQPIRAAVYRVRLAVLSADTSASQASPQPPACLVIDSERHTCARWEASIVASASVVGEFCDGCFRSARETVAWTSDAGPAWRLDEEMTLIVWMVSGSGESVDLAEIPVEFAIDAGTRLANAGGAVRATLEAHVARISVATFA